MGMSELCESDISRLLLKVGDPKGKSFETIRSILGEPESTENGDPLRCLRDSLSCVWRSGSRVVTMYFDPGGICFGADLDHIFLFCGKDAFSEQGSGDIPEIFIQDVIDMGF